MATEEIIARREFAVTDFTKIVNPGTVPVGGRRVQLFCKIECKDGRLSISGVEGPKQNGDAWGSCGQIHGGYAHRDPADDDARTYRLTRPEDMNFGPDWSAAMWLDFLDVWKRWHLNDMRAGCEHQRAAGWGTRPIDPTKPTTAYGKHFEGQRQDSWNLLGWVRPDEHPAGLLTLPCWYCGYRYGTAWLREEVPADVLRMLRQLPESTRVPAWV